MRRVSSGLECGIVIIYYSFLLVLKEGFVVLLSLDESFFKEVGICEMVNICAGEWCSALTLAVTESDSQSLSLWFTF